MFSLARQFRILPSQALAMDPELLMLFLQYLAGYARGREIKDNH